MTTTMGIVFDPVRGHNNGHHHRPDWIDDEDRALSTLRELADFIGEIRQDLGPIPVMSKAVRENIDQRLAHVQGDLYRRVRSRRKRGLRHRAEAAAVHQWVWSGAR